MRVGCQESWGKKNKGSQIGTWWKCETLRPSVRDVVVEPTRQKKGGTKNQGNENSTRGRIQHRWVLRLRDINAEEEWKRTRWRASYEGRVPRFVRFVSDSSNWSKILCANPRGCKTRGNSKWLHYSQREEQMGKKHLETSDHWTKGKEKTWGKNRCQERRGGELKEFQGAPPQKRATWKKRIGLMVDARVGGKSVRTRIIWED